MKKSIIFLAAISTLLIINFTATGDSNETHKKIITEKFEVRGVCKMCKARIEKAALIPGVRIATWDKQEQLLSATFSTKKTSKDAIELAVANAGHDTENHQAPDSIYNELPGCCKYRDGVEVH